MEECSAGGEGYEYDQGGGDEGGVAVSYEVGQGEEEANSKFMQKELAFSSKKTKLKKPVIRKMMSLSVCLMCEFGITTCGYIIMCMHILLRSCKNKNCNSNNKCYCCKHKDRCRKQGGGQVL